MKRWLIFLWLFMVSMTLRSQLPVEIFAGHKKTTIDILFFRFITNKEKQPSKILFFNRNRVSIDYAMTTSAFLPQFGFTEAISYNHPKLKGFAPVLAATILNKGVYPKAGIQFAKSRENYTLFSWVVAETLKNPDIDIFLLARYTPRLGRKWNLFSQLELVHSLPTHLNNTYSFIQRLRAGLQLKPLQFGAGLDLTQSGRKEYISTENAGIFVRYEF